MGLLPGAAYNVMQQRFLIESKVQPCMGYAGTFADFSVPTHLPSPSLTLGAPRGRHGRRGGAREHASALLLQHLADVLVLLHVLGGHPAVVRGQYEHLRVLGQPRVFDFMQVGNVELCGEV